MLMIMHHYSVSASWMEEMENRSCGREDGNRDRPFQELKISLSFQYCIFAYLIIRGVRASVTKSLKKSEKIIKCLKRCTFQCIKVLKMGFCEEQKKKSEIRLKSDILA